MTELKKRLYAHGGSLKQRYHEAVMNRDWERADEIYEEIQEFRKMLYKLGMPYKSYTDKGLRQYSRSKLKRQEKDEELAGEWFDTED